MHTSSSQALSLREVRRYVGRTQAQVAAAMGHNPPTISQLERRRHPRLSTLNRFVESLGGKLEVYARLSGRLVRLKVGGP